MISPKLSHTRRLSEDLLELACRCDEIANRSPHRIPLPALTDAERHELARLFRYCTELTAAAVTTQLMLVPYLPLEAEDQAA